MPPPSCVGLALGRPYDAAPVASDLTVKIEIPLLNKSVQPEPWFYLVTKIHCL